MEKRRERKREKSIKKKCLNSRSIRAKSILSKQFYVSINLINSVQFSNFESICFSQKSFFFCFPSEEFFFCLFLRGKKTILKMKTYLFFCIGLRLVRVAVTSTFDGKVLLSLDHPSEPTLHGHITEVSVRSGNVSAPEVSLF